MGLRKITTRCLGFFSLSRVPVITRHAATSKSIEPQNHDRISPRIGTNTKNGEQPCHQMCKDRLAVLPPSTKPFDGCTAPEYPPFRIHVRLWPKSRLADALSWMRLGDPRWRRSYWSHGRSSNVGSLLEMAGALNDARRASQQTRAVRLQGGKT